MSKKSLLFLVWLLASLFLVGCTEVPPTRTPVPTLDPNLPPPSTPGPTLENTPNEPQFAPPTFLPLPTVETGRTPAPNPQYITSFNGLSKFSTLSGLPVSGVIAGKITTLNKTANGKPEPTRALAFSPDLKWLAVADRVEIWIIEITTGKTLQRLVARASSTDDRGANSLAWSPDGKLLAAGGMKGVITIWRWDNSTNRFRAGGIPFASSPVAEVAGDTVEVAFSPDGKTLAGFGSDGQITLYDTNNGKILAGFTSEFAGHLSWSPDGTRLADEFLHMHYRSTGQTIPVELSIQNAGDSPQGVAWSPDGKIIAASGDAYELGLYNAPNGENAPISQRLTLVPLRSKQVSPTAPKIMPHLREGRKVVWSPSSNLVAVANVPEPGYYSVWDKTGSFLFSVNTESGVLHDLIWPVEGLIISAGSVGEVRFWEILAPLPPTPTPPVETTPEATPTVNN